MSLQNRDGFFQGSLWGIYRSAYCHFLGMTLTFSGIAMAIFSRPAKGEKLSLKLAPLGILYAMGGVVGKALGLVLSKKGMKSLSIGSFFGPFLGISFSLVSVKFTQTGIASTLMAMVPIFIIAPAVILYKEKVTLAEIIGAVLSVAGVALFFI